MLELHGWGDLQTELNTMSKQGGWDEMGELIDDEMLDAFAVVARARSARPPGCTRATATSSTALSFYAPYKSDPETWLPVLEALKRA